MKFGYRTGVRLAPDRREPAMCSQLWSELERPCGVLVTTGY